MDSYSSINLNKKIHKNNVCTVLKEMPKVINNWETKMIDSRPVSSTITSPYKGNLFPLIF